MAEIIEEGIAGVGQGIIQPVLMHRWKFMVKGNKQMIHLTKNTVQCDVDYLHNTLKLRIEENILGDVSDVVYDLANRGSFTCYIHSMDGNDQVLFTTEFAHATVTDHLLTYAYAKSGVLTHELLVKFDGLRLLVRSKQE